MAKFQFLNVLVIEWRGSPIVPKDKFISYIKARKLIFKEFMYHIFQVKDDTIESPSLESLLIVYQFLEVFPDNLSGVPPDMEFDFVLMVFSILRPFLSLYIELPLVSLRS